MTLDAMKALQLGDESQQTDDLLSAMSTNASIVYIDNTVHVVERLGTEKPEIHDDDGERSRFNHLCVKTAAIQIPHLCLQY